MKQATGMVQLAISERVAICTPASIAVMYSWAELIVALSVRHIVTPTLRVMYCVTVGVPLRCIYYIHLGQELNRRSGIYTAGLYNIYTYLQVQPSGFHTLYSVYCTA